MGRRCGPDAVVTTYSPAKMLPFEKKPGQAEAALKAARPCEELGHRRWLQWQLELQDPVPDSVDRVENYETEAAFTDRVQQFWRGNPQECNVLLVQADARRSSQRHIQHVKYILEKQRAQALALRQQQQQQAQAQGQGQRGWQRAAAGQSSWQCRISLSFWDKLHWWVLQAAQGQQQSPAPVTQQQPMHVVLVIHLPRPLVSNKKAADREQIVLGCGKPDTLIGCSVCRVPALFTLHGSRPSSVWQSATSHWCSNERGATCSWTR